MRTSILLLLLLLTACSPSPVAEEKAEATPQLLPVYIAPAAEERIPQLYRCAERTQVGLVQRTPSLRDARIALRVGAGDDKIAYPIGEVEIGLFANADNPVEALSREEALALYTGKIGNWAEVGGDDAPVRLWVYDQDDDLQHAFNESVLGQNPLSTLARQAPNPRAMRDAIANDAHALGILPKSQADSRLRPLYSLENLPVLVILQEEPQENLLSLIICLQEK